MAGNDNHQRYRSCEALVVEAGSAHSVESSKRVVKSQSGELQVLNKNGGTITFTQYQVDPVRFQDEVMQRARLKEVIDISAPPRIIG
jgi:hypothetical protein